MSTNDIWYLPGPFHKYEGDIKKLAREAGLRIIDANVTESRENAAEKVPEVQLKGTVQADEDKQGALSVAELKAKLDEAGVEYRGNASRSVLEQMVADLHKE